MAGAGAVAPAAAAPQAHLGTPPACLPAHLPVPTAHEAELLRQLDVPTVNISPACMQLSGKEKQLLQKTLNDLSFGLPVIVETTETTDEARNVAATTIQAHLRGHWTRCLIQAAGVLEAVHIIQQACYNFVMRRRVASLAPYTLSDKGPLSQNLRMQSVRPTLATESSTADEPLLLRETKLREHKAASSAKKAKLRARRAAGPAALFQHIAMQNARSGMLPWTARLVEALFLRMQPMADFGETQCMSLQTAIVTRMSMLETGKGDNAKAICNAVKLELLMNNNLEATAFARMLGAYLKSCANFLATAHDDRFSTFAEYINGIVQRRHDAFEEVLAYAKANGIVQGDDGSWRSTRPRPDFLCSDDSESDSSDGENEPEDEPEEDGGSELDYEDTRRGWLQLEGLPKGCSEQDIRDYLKKHRDDDPEPIEVHVWYEEHYKYSIAHVVYEGEEYSVPASLAYELSGAVFDGVTLMTGVIDVQ